MIPESMFILAVLAAVFLAGASLGQLLLRLRLAKVFGGAEQGWLVQQAQYDLAHVRRDHLKLKRLALA